MAKKTDENPKGRKYKFELVAYYDRKEQLWDVLEDIAMTLVTMCKYCGSTNCIRYLLVQYISDT